MVSLTPQKGLVRVFYNGAFGGATARYESKDYFTVDCENYTQDHAIKSGVNRFTIKLDQPGVLVKEAIVEPVTGITRTGKPLEQLSVKVASPIRAQERKPAALPYSVSRRGQRPDRPATVRARIMSGKGARIDRAEHRYPSIGIGRNGRFEMTATRGRYIVQVVLDGGYNTAAQFITVDVRPPKQSTAGRAAPLLASGTLVLLGIGSLVRFRMRVKRWLESRRES